MLSNVKYQERGTAALRRVIEESFSQPLLLLGPEGVGRKFSVLCMMRELMCSGSRDPWCNCASCYQIQRGVHPDILIVGADNERIGVEAVRLSVLAAQQYPTAAIFTCVVLDGVDDVASGEAADMLLKTLEEPPRRSRFFLLAEDRERVSPTIRSRCVEIRYGELPSSFILSEVRSRVSDDAKALVYSRMGEGSLGRALKYANSGKLHVRDHMLKVLQASAVKDVPAMFSLIDSVKTDAELAARFLGHLIHDVFMTRIDPLRVINCDCAGDIEALAATLEPNIWLDLSEKLSGVLAQLRSQKISTPFHLKTILAQAIL